MAERPSERDSRRANPNGRDSMKELLIEVLNEGKGSTLLAGGTGVLGILGVLFFLQQDTTQELSEFRMDIQRAFVDVSEEIVKLRLVTAENARCADDIRRLQQAFETHAKESSHTGGFEEREKIKATLETVRERLKELEGRRGG